MHRILLHALFALLFQSVAWAQEFVTVEAEGRCDEGLPNFRRRALSDALAEAVKQGAGVNVRSSSMVVNQNVEDDRLFSLSVGYVREYTILSQRRAEPNFVVKIRAKVGQGAPAFSDRTAIEQLLRGREMPRIGIRVKADISGVSPAEANEWVEETVQAALIDRHLRVFLLRDLLPQARLAEWDRLTGDEGAVQFREANLQQKLDFILDVTLGLRVDSFAEASQLSPEARARIYGGNTGAMEAEKVIRPSLRMKFSYADVATPIASEIFTMSGDLQKELAAFHGHFQKGDLRSAVQHYLNAWLVKQENSSLWRMLAKICQEWVIQTQLGYMRTVQFENLDDQEMTGLVQHLTSQYADTITYAAPRNFFAGGVSDIEVESRLGMMDLNAAVRAFFKESYKPSVLAPHVMVYKRNTAGGRLDFPGAASAVDSPVAPPVVAPVSADAPPPAASPDVAPAAEGKDARKPVWAYLLAALVGVALLAGVFHLGRRTQSRRSPSVEPPKEP